MAKKKWRVHAHFEACASFDVTAPGLTSAYAAARRFTDNLSCSLIDTEVEIDGKTVHIKDSDEGVRDVEVDEDYDKVEDE